MLNEKKYFHTRFEGWLSIFLNSLLFGLKIWVGIISGSIALIADAWHTLSDSFSSIIILLGIKISNKPADSEHPFGHGRAELIATLIIGVILGIIACNFVLESVSRLLNKQKVNYGILAIIITVISIITKEGMAQYALWASRKTGSQALKADGWHHRSDAISSVLILTGIFLGGIFWWIDGVLGILVALLIFYATFEIFKGSISSLIGEKPDINLVKKLKKLTYKVYKQDMKIHHMHIHTYGDHSELTFHIELPADMSLEKAHEIATRLEYLILEELSMMATIHMEPFND